MKTEQAAYLYVGAFVDELARCGLRNVAACPGSRSTPLALMLAEEPRIKLWMHLDERSAAFFALGMAKAGRSPVGLLCTSGTAAANFLPAIVEAHYAHVPLVVLTADRPPELRDTGAPQTVDQIKMYGDYARWFVEMALPEGTPDMLRYVRTIACRAIAESQGDPAGVVHLNFPFREPLVPTPVEVQMEDRDREAYSGRPDGRPYARTVTAPRPVDPARTGGLAAELSQTERGLIVVGPQTDRGLAAAAAGLSARLGYPILADPLSQVRCGAHDLQNVVDSYDAFLRDPAVVDDLVPGLVLRFGAPLTSKPVLQYLQRHAGCRQILVGAGWTDPNRLASDVIQADPVEFCNAIGASGASFKLAPTKWLAMWRDIQAVTRQAITLQLAAVDEFFEGRVFAELAACLPEASTLWASSSMPVRDLDTFYPAGLRQIQFLANRGANGIDGVVSSALGAAAASDGPTVLVIGDIAFFHDMNGLLAARQHALDLTVVLINNDGGGIFSFLPQAMHPEHFEQLFGTPHGLNFEAACGLYGASYCRPNDWAAFRSAVSAGLQSRGLKIVEVRTDRARNVELHRAVWPKVWKRFGPFAKPEGSDMTRLALPDGVHYNVELAGSGQPMVLLHGFTGSAIGWGEQLDRFASWFKVVAVDLLGHGESDAPADPTRYRMECCVEDLHSVIERLDLGRIHLLGYSMGGRAALSFALAHPECVQTLTLESASPGLEQAGERQARVITDEALAARIETGGIEAFVDEWEQLPLFASQARLPKPVRTRLRAGRLRNNPIGLANSLRGMGTGVQDENWRRLSELRMPVMFMAGNLDSKYTNIARRMAGAIPGAALAIVQRAGHAVHLERPAVFRRGVLMFLERNAE